MYKRVLLKLSGEALKGESNSILEVNHLDGLTDVIKELHDNGVEVAIVIGAGNIWRGKLANQIGIEPVPADFMGMLGTVINAVAMASNLEKKGVPAIVYSAVPHIENVTYEYNKDKANKSLAEGKVVFLAGGTGKPFFTTDTAAALRAVELDCQAIFMGKNGVDGIYTADPTVDKKAEFIKTITFKEIIERKLQVMDISAVELIKNTNIDVRVFSMAEPKNFLRVASGEDIGTTVKKGE